MLEKKTRSNWLNCALYGHEVREAIPKNVLVLGLSQVSLIPDLLTEQTWNENATHILRSRIGALIMQ